MDDSTTESKKQDETNAPPEIDREPTRHPDAALEMIEKLLPKICESQLGKACEVSVNFHVYIPPPNRFLKSKAKAAGAPNSNEK